MRRGVTLTNGLITRCPNGMSRLRMTATLELAQEGMNAWQLWGAGALVSSMTGLLPKAGPGSRKSYFPCSALSSFLQIWHCVCEARGCSDVETATSRR
jgi:hypothetical protein